MKTIKIIAIICLVVFVGISCSTKRTTLVQEKMGVQLWGENCMRCHNTPSPSIYSDIEWSTIEMHMRVRANLTANESKKIFDFIRSAN